MKGREKKGRNKEQGERRRKENGEMKTKIQIEAYRAKGKEQRRKERSTRTIEKGESVHEERMIIQ
jgi:hypothetical protein